MKHRSAFAGTASCAVIVCIALAGAVHEPRPVSADGTRPAMWIAIDSVMTAYPLAEGTASKMAEVGRLEGASVNYLITKSPVRPHFHRDRDEVVYIVQGKATVSFGPPGVLLHPGGTLPTAREAFVGGRRTQVKPGSILLIPRGTAHQVDVVGSQPVVAVSVFSPAFADNDRISLSE